MLASCYRSSLRIAEQRSITSLAFPAISTGAYGYPLDEAAEIATSTVALATEELHQVNWVRFVLFDPSSMRAYISSAQKWTEGKREYSLERAS